VDHPATRHNGGGVLSFADGHAEAWRWLESTTLSADTVPGWVQGIQGIPGRDRGLTRNHTTVPRVPLP
jgi:prepilin-type processing-associated H-X9-DG protein